MLEWLECRIELGIRDEAALGKIKRNLDSGARTLLGDLVVD